MISVEDPKRRHCERRKLAVAMTITWMMLMSACAVGPNYIRPTVATPAHFKEDTQSDHLWHDATPADHLDRGAWWTIFSDPELNALESRVVLSNQNIKQAEAAYRQAVALADSARAAFWPTITANAGASLGKSSAFTGGTNTASKGSTNASYTIGATASWVPDVWGGIRRSVEASEANAQRSAADLANAQLSAQGELAQTYFQLRLTDAQQKLLDDSVTAYRGALSIKQNQYDSGIASRADVMTAQNQMDSAVARATDLRIVRAQLEHAIALLVGEPPAQLTVPIAKDWLVKLPDLPLSVPSEILQRRPDIASAERNVAQANAQIGVATAARFPSLTLSANGGFANSALSDLFTLPNGLWSVGAALFGTIFEGGKLAAQERAAYAAHDLSVALYRQTVLTAFQQVEDNLAAVRLLKAETSAQDSATKAAKTALDVTNDQYNAGTASYLQVLDAQITALSNEGILLGLRSRQYSSSVSLIMALGGGLTPL